MDLRSVPSRAPLPACLEPGTGHATNGKTAGRGGAGAAAPKTRSERGGAGRASPYRPSRQLQRDRAGRAGNGAGMCREHVGNSAGMVQGTVRESSRNVVGMLRERCRKAGSTFFFPVICTEFCSFGKCHFLKTEILQGGKGSFASSADSKILRKSLGAVKTFPSGLFYVESSADAFHNDFWFTINRTAAEIQIQDPFQHGKRCGNHPQTKASARRGSGAGGRGTPASPAPQGSSSAAARPRGSSSTTAGPAKIWKEVSTFGEFPGRNFILC